MKRNLNGTTIRVPVIYLLGWNNLVISESWMSSLLSRLARMKEGGFLDVGVNVGQTLLKVKTLFPEIRYIGFEPNPTCVFYVQQLIRENRYKHCTIYPVGIASETGLLELHCYSEGITDSSASIIPDFRTGQQVYRREVIPCFSVSDLGLGEAGPISIVKIDVEGAELEVITGLRDLLATQRPFVLLEVLPTYDPPKPERLDRQERIERLLEELGYRIMRIIKTENEVISLEPVSAFGIHGRIDWIDYLLCPSEQNI